MKVLQLIKTLHAGGAELHLLTLCRHLVKSGVEIVVGSLRKHLPGVRSLREDFLDAGVRIVDLPEGKLAGLKLARAASRLLKDEAPDILHTHLPRAHYVGAMGNLLSSVPRVCSVHDIYRGQWSGGWTLPLLSRVWRRANAVIAISDAVKTWLVLERKVPEESVTRIHYGIDAQAFREPQRNLRQEWGLERRPIVGSLGRLEHRKGHDVLIRAMQSVLKEIPDAVLLIAGSDEWGYGEEIRKQIDNLGLRDRVRLVGFQNDTASFLHSVDLFALASRTEGFGQVFVEAMAAGKAVVATRISPVDEIVLDRETGRLATGEDPASFSAAITELLQDDRGRREMGIKGLHRVETDFTPERMVRQTLELYESVLRATS